MIVLGALEAIAAIGGVITALVLIVLKMLGVSTLGWIATLTSIVWLPLALALVGVVIAIIVMLLAEIVDTVRK